MRLEKVDETETGAAVAGMEAERVPVTIPPDKRERMGMTLGTVEKRTLSRDIRTSARIVADETKLYRVTTKVGGWVEKLHVSITGQAVKKGDALLTLYSPDLVSAQQEFLAALQAAKAITSKEDGDRLVQAAKRRLALWDIDSDSIERLEKNGTVERTMTLNSLAAGIVTEKSVLAGQKIQPGDSLLVVTDLSVVWGEADIYESDLPYVRTGMPVEVSLVYWPGRIFTGRVSFLSPALEPQSRTLKARLEIPNPDLTLKLEMFADARLSYELPDRLAVPESAVMRNGARTLVFRDEGDNKLAPVDIKVGARAEGYYEVVSGLKAGDRVVTSANFLVDSESSLKAAQEAVTR
jgi:Cu(I)/Ag(I) efflux system membrane fusion protein